MENKELWQQAINQYSDIPVFMYPWWLDAANPGQQWDVFVVTDDKGEVKAALTYCLGKRWKMNYVSLPRYAHYLGVWFRWDVRENPMQVKYVLNQLVEQLDKLNLSYYYQQMPVNLPIGDAFLKLGFKTKQLHCYRLDDLTDLTTLLNSFSKIKKKLLQKALTLHLDSNMSAEDFCRFYSEAYTLDTTEFVRENFLVMYQKAIREQQGEIISIQNQQNETLAAAFLIWDKRTLYLLMSGVARNQRDSGAEEMLIWEAIKQAEKRELQFDFCNLSKDECKQYSATDIGYIAVRKYYNFFFRFAKLFTEIK